MTRFTPYLSELQPQMFVEVHPDLARERGLAHGGWATIATARSAIEARVLVTDRMRPVNVDGRVTHQVGLPYHWGSRGLTTGGSANDLLHLALDPNVHIMETKGLTCDIRPGRRARGPALREFVKEKLETAHAAREEAPLGEPEKERST
jgi:formate dehydrogenase major subunit